MAITKTKKARRKIPPAKDKLPPGGLKIVDAFISLLRKKEFSAITTAELAEVSGANEALIYRYFGSKRGLLHSVLFYFIETFVNDIEFRLQGVEGSLNKLKEIIRGHIFLYQSNLVFAKILILEVRNFPGYFESVTYESAKRYTKVVNKVIEEGVRDGEIRDDISRWVIMQIIMGGIEHLSMPTLLFKKNLVTDELADNFCNLLFDGIRKTK
jgi:TetR/AcrR family transcriptional regulator, fatty acid metabolism regulator protein